jgi:hypothetical protein
MIAEHPVFSAVFFYPKLPCASVLQGPAEAETLISMKACNEEPRLIIVTLRNFFDSLPKCLYIKLGIM